MGRILHLGPLGRQSPIFGIHHANIADRLTHANWQDMATVRMAGSQWLYLYIAAGTTIGEQDRDIAIYLVQAYNPALSTREYEQHFDTLEDALAYINGEDGGLLAQTTTLASSEQYPIEQGTETTVSTIHRQSN